MFSRKLDIRLVISVVITCVNVNKMNVHVKNLKINKKTASTLVWVDRAQNNGNNVWQKK